jgi:3-oxoacyl-[acyl-carrier protein] reductase
MDLGLFGASAVVSGGSKGMGLATAKCLASEGSRVALLARTRSDLEREADRLMSLGAPDAFGVVTDLTAGESVAAAFAEVELRWGGLNVLVNAAGPVDVGIGQFSDVNDDEWMATLDIGVLSVARCVRAALPLLRKAQWARIVNISAHSTKRQSPGIVAYTAAKAALTSLSKNLSGSLASHGILVNTVSPGSFLSDGMKNYLRALPPDRGADPESLVDAMRIIDEDFGHPAQMGRAAQPAEIGPLVAFLCSQSNTYITGADINIDGGSDFT